MFHPLHPCFVVLKIKLKASYILYKCFSTELHTSWVLFFTVFSFLSRRFMYPRLTFNFSSFCIHVLSSGLQACTWFYLVLGTNPGHYFNPGQRTLPSKLHLHVPIIYFLNVGNVGKDRVLLYTPVGPKLVTIGICNHIPLT